MAELFLIGGGWNTDGFPLTYGRFVTAATKHGTGKILILLALEDEAEKSEITEKYTAVFTALGVGKGGVLPYYLSEINRPSINGLSRIDFTGVFVGGGLTPLYQELLSESTVWIQYLQENDIPYCGFSAGASVAAHKAIVGGWKLRVGTRDIPILDPDLSEGLEYLEVRDGLGLIPHSIDVHGSQWGTLSRVLHAVDQGQIQDGFAIDESTMLELTGGTLSVHGLGQVYRVSKLRNGEATIKIFRDGDIISERKPY